MGPLQSQMSAFTLKFELPSKVLTELEHAATLYALRQEGVTEATKKTLASSLLALLTKIVALEKYSSEEWDGFLQLIMTKPNVSQVSNYVSNKPQSRLQEADDNFLYSVCEGLKSALALSEIGLLPHITACAKEMLLENTALAAENSMAITLLALYICSSTEGERCDIEALTLEPHFQGQVFELLATTNTIPDRLTELFSAFHDLSDAKWHTVTTLKELEVLFAFLKRLTSCRLGCVQSIIARLTELDPGTNNLVQETFFTLINKVWVFESLSMYMDITAYLHNLHQFIFVNFMKLIYAIHPNQEKIDKFDDSIKECMTSLSDILYIFADDNLARIKEAKVDFYAPRAELIKRSIIEFLHNCYLHVIGKECKQKIFTHIKDALLLQRIIPDDKELLKLIGGDLRFPLKDGKSIIFKCP